MFRLIERYLPMWALRRLMRRHEGRLKQMIILRTDLKMRRGKEIAQGAHASMGAYLAHRRDPFVRMWLDGPFAKVAVGVDTEEELTALHAAALRERIPCCLITDAGRTEFNGVPTRTALAIGPGDPDRIHALTGHLKLR